MFLYSLYFLSLDTLVLRERNEMRSLYPVIDEMLAVIPDDETYMRQELHSIQGSLMYSAPEMESFWWTRCAEILNGCIPAITMDWHDKLGNIFSGRNI